MTRMRIGIDLCGIEEVARMSQSYFVFSFSEDGDVSVRRFTKDDLEAKLNEEYWGPSPTFLDANSNFENESGLLIIKGERIAPGPVETVKRWGV